VFPDAEADTVLVKADGWMGSPSSAATLRQTRNADTLDSLDEGVTWAPVDTAERWAAIRLSQSTVDSAAGLLAQGDFVGLAEYGNTSLGAVTGGNRFFALSPSRSTELGIPRRDLLQISPPGSGHLRGLALTRRAMVQLGAAGHATWLLYPSERPADTTLRYIESGHQTGVDQAYKCRVRTPWWRVPVLRAPDLLLTYMNADTVRLTTNDAGVHHLNSVHGVYLSPENRHIAREVLPIASLNSLTLLSAEMSGRSYGGGILKMEPREADRWWMPAPTVLVAHRHKLIEAKPRIRHLLKTRRLSDAVAVVDSILLGEAIGETALGVIRSDHASMASRRRVRGQSGR
jgi:hypothetical protein